jgi:SPP1 gp7 family putative phage head morphogenesis protein
VSACVKTLMDEIASLDWDIVAKDGFEYEWVADDIKAVKGFLSVPNKNGEPFAALLRALLKDILEIDAGVIVKVFDLSSYDFDELEPKSGAPVLKPKGERRMTELYVRDGASFLKEIDKFGFEKGFWQYSYQIPAHPMWFDRDEVVYISEHNRSMSCYGYARTQAVLDIVKSLHYSTLYNKRFFEESPIPDGALSVLDTNESEMRNFMSYWNNEFKAQPHKVAIINKDLKWQPFAVSQRELEFLETQKWYFNIIISAFGLSPSELGITDDLNRATSATQSELVKRKGIRPFLKLLESYINCGVVSEFGFEGVEFQFIYDDPAEKNARLNNYQLELSMGIKTINEVREEQGLEPLPGGDVSNNMVSMMSQGAQGASGGVQDEKRESPGYKTTLDREESKQEPKNESSKKSSFKTMSYDELIAEHKRLTQTLLYGSESAVKDITEEQIRELEQYMAEAKNKKINKNVDDGQYYHDQPITQPRRPNGAMFQPQNADYKEKNLVNCPICGLPTLAALNSEEALEYDTRCTQCGARFRMQELLDAPVMEEIANVLQQHNMSDPIFRSVNFTKSVDDEMSIKEYSGISVTKSFVLAADYAKSKAYKALLKKYLNDLTKAQIDSIIKILEASLKSSDTLSMVAKKIENIVGNETRANLIARTEIIRLANQGNIETMKERGVEKVKFLAAPEDGRLCEHCKKLDNKIFSIKEAEGLIPIHPRCRCTTTDYYED